LKLVELNKIDYNWIEFENKDSKQPPSHFGDKNDEARILQKAFLSIFITKTSFWIFIAEKWFYQNRLDYWIKLSNFRADNFGIRLIAYSTFFLFSFLKVLKALYLENYKGKIFHGVN
jgi:hypothetical protein